jgi:hypothetical protein
MVYGYKTQPRIAAASISRHHKSRPVTVILTARDLVREIAAQDRNDECPL